ncbi:MAG: TonB-dependent receptor, partial [Chitinophagaceae bacterium]
MQKLFLVLCAIICVVSASAQNNLNIIVKNKESQRPIKNVNIEVKGKNILSTTDENGIALIKNIPNGGQSLIISCIGFQTSTISIILPYSASSLFQVELTPSEDELDEVIISSTRTSRTIRNTPTRVETIELEEIDEKSNMRPANVSMILHESTGIAVQQTSATSGNASIRIQGLDGRYTQLLKDGYASFGNFASGLSVLEIPPLDLAQVEIIKGPSSTLYGAGAIAGVVNFISRTPKEKADYNFIVNQSNVGQTNIGGFTMKRNKKIGYSLLALVNFQKPYDVDNDDFTELPRSKDFTIHPKIFIYPNERTSIILGNSFTTSDKTGGDIYLIKGGPTSNHTYFENNNTSRNTTTFDLSIKPNEKDLFRVKSSFNYFKRKIGTPGYLFNGSNYNFYNDVSYLKNLENQSLIFGGNLIYDNFKERDASDAKDFKTKTAGLY